MKFITDFGSLTKWERLSNIGNLRIQPFLLVPGHLGRLPGGTSAPQRQKLHTDDVNQCLHNESGSHEAPNENLFDFMFLLLDYGNVLRSTANEPQQMLFPKRNIFQQF